jgi:large subunit ribosomal protein L2
VPLRKFKATSPGRRYREVPDFRELTKGARPERGLTAPTKRAAGRNAQGKVTTRHRGGGEKVRYRVIDFKRNKDGVPARVASIQYDPNRSARIALLAYRDGEKRYILAPDGLRAGDTVMSGPEAEPRPGNALPVENIPVGTQVHAVELEPGKGAQMVRAAGGVAQLLAKEGAYAQIRLPSGHIRIVHVRCRATVGQVSNLEHENRSIGGAGHRRRMGWRPAVRGVAMTPRDHPHGGGEGRAPIGGKPQTRWGKPAMGWKTRRNQRTDRFVIRAAKKRKGG